MPEKLGPGRLGATKPRRKPLLVFAQIDRQLHLQLLGYLAPALKHQEIELSTGVVYIPFLTPIFEGVEIRFPLTLGCKTGNLRVLRVKPKLVGPPADNLTWAGKPYFKSLSQNTGRE